MATGKPPWCQLQEVTALFHIGSTKSAPPFPEHLSEEAKDFLWKCLQKEPHLRASATELLQHPFVIRDYKESQPPLCRSLLQNSGIPNAALTTDNKSIRSNVTRTISGGLKDICNMGKVRCSTVYPEKFSGTSNLWRTCGSDDDLCMLDDKDDFVNGVSEHQSPAKLVDDFNKSFNPMCEPNDDWPCKFDDSPEVGRSGNLFSGEDCGIGEASCNGETDFTFPSEPSMDDEEVTESKIRAFLDGKALDLKKLQDGFYSTSDLASPKAFGEGGDALSKLPAKSKSPRGVPSRRLSTIPNVPKPVSPARHTKVVVDSAGHGEQPGELPELKELQKDGFCSRPSFSERQRRWKEELDKELELERERLRQAGAKISSPSKRVPNQQRERLPFTSTPK